MPRAASRASLKRLLYSLINPFVQILAEVLPTIEEPSMTYVTYYSGSFNADQIAFVLAQLDRILKSASPMASESLNIQFLTGSLEGVLVDSLPQKYRLTSPASENSNYHKRPQPAVIVSLIIFL